MSTAFVLALLSMPGGPEVREVALPFDVPREAADQLSGALSVDGRRLVVWGRALAADRWQTRLAVVDLDAGRVVAARTISSRLSVVAADAHHVYAGLAEADGLLVLAADTLAERSRLGTPPVSRLVPGDGRITVVPANAPRLTLSVPGLTVADPAPLPEFEAGDRLKGLITVGGLAGGGGDVAPILNYYPERPAHEPAPAPDPPDDRWGVRVSRTGLVAASGRRIGPLALPANFPPQSSALLGNSRVLADRPLAATARLAEWFPDAGRPQELATRVVVIYQRLADGAVAAQAVTPERRFVSAAGRPRPPMLPPELFARSDDSVALLSADRVYLVPPPAVPADLPEPLRTAPRRAALVPPGRPVTAAMPATVGGRPPYTYTLADPTPGVSVDATSGALTVDPGRVAGWLLPSLAQLLPPQQRMGQLAQAGPPEVYAQKASVRVERLTGQRPSGLPVWVAVRFSVRDAALETLPAVGGFMIDLPLADVRAAAEDVARKLAAQRAAAAGPPAGGELATLKVRVQALEARLDELNRKLDAVLKALDAQKPKDK